MDRMEEYFTTNLEGMMMDIMIWYKNLAANLSIDGKNLKSKLAKIPKNLRKIDDLQIL